MSDPGGDAFDGVVGVLVACAIGCVIWGCAAVAVWLSR
jgi:hypothetical protein